MLGSLFATAVPLIAVMSVSAPQQNAQSILETVQARQAERWETVDNYTVIQSMLGMQTPVYFEKFLVGEERLPAFRMVPAGEYMNADGPGGRQQMGQMADAYEMLADSMQGQGMPGMDAGMMSQMGAFLRAGSSAQVDDGRADAAAHTLHMAAVADRAKLEGRERIDGRDAFVLRIDDLSGLPVQQSVDGGQFTMSAIGLWIDTEEYVPLKFAMEGEATANGRTMPITIEKLDQDYRRVGPLYEPHRQVLRMSGLQEMLDPKERAELERARAQMEEMKAQLAEMPEAQRRFIEGRMKSAMEQFERMTGDGSFFETVIEVAEIRINEGPPSNPAAFAPGGETSSSRASRPEPTRERDGNVDRGPLRSDLARFHGVYGIADQSGQPRNLFVTESCQGQLVAGAMWGDASPWWMTSVSDAEFEMSDSFQSLRIEFELGPDGTAQGLRHDLDGLPSALTRIGPLPAEWQECVQDTRG